MTDRPSTHDDGTIEAARGERARDAAAAANRAAAYAGLVGGAVLVYLALVGMIEAFTDEVLVSSGTVHLRLLGVVMVDGVRRLGTVTVGAIDLPANITLGHTVWLGTLAGIGYWVVQRLAAPGVRRSGTVARAAGAAGIAATVLAALVALGQLVNLRAMFVNATLRLWEILTFSRGVPDGLVAGIAAGLVMGVLGVALALAPVRLRRGVLWGGALVVILGALQDLFRSIVAGGVFEAAGGARLYDALYTRNGLSAGGALAVLAVTLLAYVAAPHLRRPLDRRLAGLPPGRRRHVRSAWRYVLLALGFLFLLTIPASGIYVTDVANTVGIFVLMGLGLNIVVGYAGLLDLGYVAFFAIGAYAMGYLTGVGPGGAEASLGLGFWAALPVAVVASIVAGVLLGIPVLKTHGDYLAIITLGFGEIIRILAISDWLKPWIGGAQGLKQIPKSLELPALKMGILGTVELKTQQELYLVIVVFCALGTYVAWRLRHSRYGRAWMSVREDEPVAEAMGVNLVNTKLFAFASGAALAGLSGAVFASKLQSIFPTSFALLISINVLVMIIVGGMGSLPGVYLGALVLVGLPELLREFSDFRLLIYGAVLVMMMLKRPEGLWPTTLARREYHGLEDTTPDAPTDAESGSVPA